LVEEGRRSGFHTLLARVADGNGVSLHLHETLGFRPVGVMREVGRKFARRIDVHLLQLIYADPANPTAESPRQFPTSREPGPGAQS
jgi:L-amino acid N-acyltransferase YncA